MNRRPNLGQGWLVRTEGLLLGYILGLVRNPYSPNASKTRNQAKILGQYIDLDFERRVWLCISYLWVGHFGKVFFEKFKHQKQAANIMIFDVLNLHQKIFKDHFVKNEDESTDWGEGYFRSEREWKNGLRGTSEVLG